MSDSFCVSQGDQWKEIHNNLELNNKGPYKKNALCSQCKKHFQNPSSASTRVISYISKDYWYHTICFEKKTGKNTFMYGEGKTMFL